MQKTIRGGTLSEGETGDYVNIIFFNERKKMKRMWNELKEMYERLGDEKSRYIFRKRLAYNLCN